MIAQPRRTFWRRLLLMIGIVIALGITRAFAAVDDAQTISFLMMIVAKHGRPSETASYQRHKQSSVRPVGVLTEEVIIYERSTILILI